MYSAQSFIYYETEGVISQSLKYQTQMAIMIGSQIIFRIWKLPGEFPLQDFKTELGKVAAYERMTYRKQHKIERYVLEWCMYRTFDL